MTRRMDWADRLSEYLLECRDTQFEWGTHDCCRFAAKAVQAMTDRDPMEHFTYDSEFAALRLIAEAGSLEALLRQTLGEPLPSAGLAGRGDVVLGDLDTGPAVGICAGNQHVFALAPAGLATRPRRAARLAWRVA